MAKPSYTCVFLFCFFPCKEPRTLSITSMNMLCFSFFLRARRTGYVGEGKKAFLRLKNEVLDQILLRRTKSNRLNDICLPPRIVRVRQHRLDEREEVRL